MVTDPIADMLTRIRNAIMAGRAETTVPSSRMKVRIAKILAGNGYISGFKVEQDGAKSNIRLRLKYVAPNKPAITGIKRVSTPGRRVYVSAGEIPRILRGLGINIVSTNKGILTDAEARKEKCGGELLCSVW
ncbi:MAG: 30S ribosomal protein S8 [Nitrospinae bacterium]|nr:30S ribosomal protein S8 [Nitrospinota bacterium]